MCTVHILFGESEAERRSERRALDDVYRTFRDGGAEKDIILCGDFNLDPDDAGWDELKAEDGMRAASTEIIPESGQIFEFDEVIYPPGACAAASRLTSDHRPISIRARIDGKDDD